jgi:heme-degrading monooxygenase HmoA
VAQVQKSRGWDGVSRAFTNLPQSSEQILHIEKYFSHEAPVKLAVPDVSKQLGSDWKRIDYDVNGEWSYYLILDQFLKSDNESKRASEGWGGDRYAVYENSRTGEAVIMQMSQWDSEQDAIEFFNAYAKRTARRYGQLQTVPSSESQELVRQWTTGEGTVLLERRGNRVVVIEGVSDASRIPSLRSKLWS